MHRISRMFALPLAVAAAGAASQDGVLPAGVKAVWDVAKAYREATASRERISINGLWRWQPGAAGQQSPPARGWGYLRVPEPWPGGGQRNASLFFAHPDWQKARLGDVTEAWYQREITVPREWAGRRVTLYAEYVNSYAVVFVDGARAGELRYPSGEVDLTARCRPGRTYVLSMLVVAMPLQAVMLSYNDTASARKVEGKVARRGLCGDVYLSGTPSGARITEVKIDPSVRRWQITFDTAVAALRNQASYILRARIDDGARRVREFTSRPFTRDDLASGRIHFTEHWRPEKLWDIHTPGNQYRLSLALLDGSGKMLDAALPVRFGFREFWIDGRDFYLNGSRIFLSAIPLDNGQLSTQMASYEATRATLQRYKSFGINFVYTHNYGCEPGAHLSFEEILRAADDEGVLLSFSQPHFGHYDWTKPDADSANGYAQHAGFYVRVAQNHPAAVCYSTSHNGTGYSEDMNPDMIDGIQAPRDSWALRNASRALRAEAIIRRLDTSRFVYHHSSGNLGVMHTSNFYANWAPAQEMSDWFEHWATLGVKPLFTCEYSVPFLWDWAMYRGWYKGKREFGSAVVPWEYCVAEWDAQFLGDRSYRVSEEEKTNLRWEAEQFRKGRTWHRWDYPFHLNTTVFEDRLRVVASYLNDNWRAFRTWGVSAISPWEYGSYWNRPAEKPLDLQVDWEKLQRPGPRPVYVREEEARARMAFRAADYQPTAAAEALYRNNMPLLAYIAGKTAAFTSKDHNFTPGEAVEKQLIVINNARVTVTAECSWRLELPQPVSGTASVTLPTGEQKRIPLRFDLPAELAPGRYQLRASVAFSDGQRQEDSFAIDVLPRRPALQISAKIAVFDPKGETWKRLQSMGVRAERVAANTDLAGFDLLIAGRGALTVNGAAPQIARVRDGLKVIVFEQSAEVLEKRFGFRIAEYGLRQVFPRVPGHPALAGIAEANLRDWRGAATLLPARLAYERSQQFNYVPTVKWAGLPVTRLWRAGNRGNVASVLIEKPAAGDFLPILDGGYSLQYSPLVEYREGRGMVLFCQLDVNGRTESDPAADAVVRNLLRYAALWQPAPRRAVMYAGDAAGKKHLEAAGVRFSAGGGLLVVGPGGGRELDRAAVAKLLATGGRVLAIGLDEREANALLAAKISVASKEHIAAWFEPFGAASPFAGISPAEVHNRDPRALPLIMGGAETAAGGVLAASGGNVVLCQLVPWQFDYSSGRMNVKRTFRRVSCLTARLLGNLGAEMQSPLLARFAKPAGEAEKRWLEGLYLDTPEEWDDPYRFFRW